MNVLVVSNLYPPVVFGGYEILCAQVVERLRARGHTVHILTSRFRATEVPADPRVRRTLELTTAFPLPGQPVGRVDFRMATQHRTALANVQHTREALLALRPELVFCWSLNRITLGPVAAAQLAHVPVVYSVNDEHPRQFRPVRRPRGARELARFLAERAVWPLATLAWYRRFPVAVISAALKRNLLGHGVPFEHAAVIHQGVPLERFPYRPHVRAPGAPLRLLFVGQLSRAKGVHTALKALAEARDAGERALQLSVVGDGVPEYEHELRAFVRAAGLAEHVRFLGRLPHEALPAVYHDHEVLIFPSEWEEPFGLTHLEAMACGTAVVSTTTGGSAELIRHEGNALAYPAGAAPELAARLRRLAQDEALRQALVAAARRDVETRFSLAGYVTALENFLAAARPAPQRRGEPAR